MAGRDVPDFDGGVGVPRNEDVVAQLHAGGERLVAHERVFAGARLHVPDANGRIERSADDVNTIELKRK